MIRYVIPAKALGAMDKFLFIHGGSDEPATAIPDKFRLPVAPNYFI
jgi:hypothetical protein